MRSDCSHTFNKIALLDQLQLPLEPFLSRATRIPKCIFTCFFCTRIFFYEFLVDPIHATCLYHILLSNFIILKYLVV